MHKRKYGTTPSLSIEALRRGFEMLSYVDAALLFGSRARGESKEKSDYDFALLMDTRSDEGWGMQSKAWMDLCRLFGLKEYDLDVVDLTAADDLMRQEIAESYILLKGRNDDIRRLLGA